MSEWTRSILKDMAELRFGKTPPRSEARFWNPPDGHPWTTIADMRTDPVVETAETVSEAGLPFAGRSVSAGSLMMSFKLTVGRVARAGTELLTNEAIVSVHGLEGKADDGWLYHALPGIARGGVADTAVKGSTLNKEKLENLEVQLPPLDEQRRIAEILDTIDETIQATEHVIAKSILIEQGLKWDLVGRRSAADDGWERVTIGDLGLVVTGGTPPTADERYWNGPVPFITPGDINARSDVCGTDRHVTQLGARLGKRIPPGSIAIVCIGSTIGKIGRVYESSVTNQQINAVIPSAERDSEFVACVSELARHTLVAEAGRQAVPIVNASTLRSLPVNVCPPDVQREIGAHLVSMRDRIASEYAVLAKLRRLRFGLGADLLSGRVRTVAA